MLWKRKVPRPRPSKALEVAFDLDPEESIANGNGNGWRSELGKEHTWGREQVVKMWKVY